MSQAVTNTQEQCKLLIIEFRIYYKEFWQQETVNAAHASFDSFSIGSAPIDFFKG